MKTPRFVLLALLSALAWPAGADEGHDHDHDHDHDHAPTAVTANGPQRLPDGAVFLPKPAQRQMAVRTFAAHSAALPRAVELAGRVIMDPNAGGKVQALVAGRVEAGPHGLPSVGQAVRKGQVLAYVHAAASPIEVSNQAAQLAELRADRALAQKRLARLQALADTVPRKEIEAAQGALAGIDGRLAAVERGLSAREALASPVTGVIASANVVAGQVVEARELLFEVVDPKRLWIEALAYHAELAHDVGAAFIAVGGGKAPLRFLGAGKALREQALPLAFRAEGPALASLAVGQPVRVVVQTRATVAGMAVPAASVMKNASNQTIVWIKAAPERFEPRVVRTQALDADTVAVTAGLRAGDRVVTSGATLINQVR